MDPEFKAEVIALNQALDDLDYFQVLKVSQRAFTDELKKAYFNQSRLFHPDKYYQEDPALVAMISKVFKRLTEAYKLLTDPKKRAAYTKAINGPERKKFLRYDPKLFEQAKGPEDEGQTPQGKKYYQLAKTAMGNLDYKSAKINLQLATKMEPNNQTFKTRLAEMEETLKLKKQKV